MLLRPDCDDATRASAVEGFKTMFGEGLEAWEQTEHGLKPNAYEIKGYPTRTKSSSTLPVRRHLQSRG